MKHRLYLETGRFTRLRSLGSSSWTAPKTPHLSGARWEGGNPGHCNQVHCYLGSSFQPTLLQREIEITRQVCLDALGEPQCNKAVQLLREHGVTGERARSMLCYAAAHGTFPPELLALRQSATESGLAAEARLIERAFLLEQALNGLAQLPSLPAVESVRRLWCKEIELVAVPKAELLASLGMEGRFFIDLCRVIAGKRFPSGQHHWEIAGFPRSWILRPPAAQLPRLASFLLFSTRGFRPFFETHFRFAPPGTVFVERAFVASFHRMAASLAFQPHILGLMAASWLYSRETIRVSPYLSFFREVFLDAGGVLVDMGPAAEHDGFLEGNLRRAELYRRNEYRPTFTVALCSRAQALTWLKRHPEAERLADNVHM